MTFDLGLSTQRLGLWTSDFRLRTSDFSLAFLYIFVIKFYALPGG